MKQAFMQGVSTLNLHAMSVLKYGPPPVSMSMQQQQQALSQPSPLQMQVRARPSRASVFCGWVVIDWHSA